jgi:hypothetical protein
MALAGLAIEVLDSALLEVKVVLVERRLEGAAEKTADCGKAE